MATSNNTIKTRIQLKSDTEANWNKAGPKEGSNGFVPLSGELIVYTPDATHPFSRLKVGDGGTNVVALPFIDSGTLNGNETEVVKVARFADFPSPGSNDKLYIDLSTSKIYHYAIGSGYTPLSNFNYNITTSTIGSVTSWVPGTTTKASIENNIFKITNGTLPELLWKRETVVTDVTKEA
jgi:hypothetical protein